MLHSANVLRVNSLDVQGSRGKVFVLSGDFFKNSLNRLKIDK